MTLNKTTLNNKDFWLSKGYSLPQFDLNAVAEKTQQAPIWLHFGAGNIFRCFPALAHQKLLNNKLASTGIVVCEMFDDEIIDKAFTPFDNLNITVTAKNGSTEKTVVASITSALKGSSTAQLDHIFTSPSLQIVSYTITEKGYHPTEKVIIKTAELLYKRWLANAAPLALLSMDNCTHNGQKLKSAVIACIKQQQMPEKLLTYINEKVSFPLSMIDKITPRPSIRVQKMLADDGIETEIVCTAKNTYTSSFVNAETTEYLVIEDNFPNGRPSLEHAGIIFTNAQTVNMVEKMKVCTCLNPLHTVLAVFGCLLGYKTIWQSIEDKGLKHLVEKIGYTECLPVVTDPVIINPQAFLHAVLNERFPNPFIPDTPQRIACDTSQKIPIRFGQTLKIYAQRENITELTYIPIFIAGWLRYLLALDDNGVPFTLSPDPRLNELTAHLTEIKLQGTITQKINLILSDKSIFGIDLVKHGLNKKVEAHFAQMISGTGAVRKLLHCLLLSH